MAKNTDTFKLKYGQNEIHLSQSETLFGIRPKQNGLEDVTFALRRSLDDGSWRDAGTIGGFRIIAVEDADIDTDLALDQLRLDPSVTVGTHVFELPEGRGIYTPTGDIYIEFKENATKLERESILDEYHLSIKEARENNGLILSVTPDSPNPIKVSIDLQAKPEVAIAEPDLATKAAIKVFETPNDTLLNDQWHLRNIGFHRNTSLGFVAGADARVVDAWLKASSFGLANIIVAVIDDGFDLDHPDLSTPGKVVHPWDFTRRNSDPRPDWGDWHGTACAGVAVASVGGGGVLGGAPGCTLMPVRWGPDLSDDQIEAWFGYVASKGAAVVSCSWGAANPYFPLSTRAYRAIEKCAMHGRGGLGCVIVFAAGNSNRDINDPNGQTLDGFAIHPNVITVAASTSRDSRSNYSNFGNEISVCAPSSGAGGWGILTSDVTGIAPRTGYPFGYAQGDYTFDFGGTSSACPLVAGIAALVLSIDPSLTQSEVKSIIQQTARKIGPEDGYTATGHSREFGTGCVNALAAIVRVIEDAEPKIKIPRPKSASKQRNKKKAVANW